MKTLLLIFMLCGGTLYSAPVLTSPKAVNHYDKYNRYQGRSVPQSNGTYKFYDNRNIYQYRLVPTNPKGTYNKFDNRNQYQGKQR